MSTLQARQPVGIPIGGQFAAVNRPETVLALDAGDGSTLIRIPSDPRLHRLVFEDRPANEEARSYARSAVRQVLDGDCFDVVYTEPEKQDILEEADRDGSIHEAIDRLKERTVPAHHFGAETVIELRTIRTDRLRATGAERGA